jgi:acyl dehydratase
MTVDRSILGRHLGSTTFEYTQLDLIIYALGVGAGLYDDELPFVFESELRPLPTFLVCPGFALLNTLHEVLGVPQESLLHGEQRLTVERPLPRRGRLEVDGRITALWDKGSAAVIDTTVEVRHEGTRIARAVYSTFLRGGGGFGGERGSGLAPVAADRSPDRTLDHPTSLAQAMLYRLSGDPNPLHIDPAAAARAGFARPILHGLCTYGIATRLAMRALTENGASSLAAADGRFTGVVFPGETLRLELWHEDGGARARVQSVERGVTVIDPLVIRVAHLDAGPDAGGAAVPSTSVRRAAGTRDTT